MMILPQRKFTDVDVLLPPCGLQGIITLKARRNGRVVREREFNNLVTDLGLDRWGSLGSAFVYGQSFVGTGTTAPAVTDTGLAAQLAFSTAITPLATTSSGTASAPYWGQCNGKWVYATGAVVGNITEVGFGGGAALLFSRALVLDGGGIPVAFPVSADEQLEVYYSVRCYSPPADVAAAITITGMGTVDTITRPKSAGGATWAPFTMQTASNTNSMTTNPSGQAVYSGDLVAETAGNPVGSLGQASSITTAAYVNGTHYRDSTITYGPTAGNGNIRTHGVSIGVGSFQIRFDPVIPKTNTKTLVLNQRVSWGRYP